MLSLWLPCISLGLPLERKTSSQHRTTGFVFGAIITILNTACKCYLIINDYDWKVILLLHREFWSLLKPICTNSLRVSKSQNMSEFTWKCISNARPVLCLTCTNLGKFKSAFLIICTYTTALCKLNHVHVAQMQMRGQVFNHCIKITAVLIFFFRWSITWWLADFCMPCLLAELLIIDWYQCSVLTCAMLIM